MRTDLHRKGAIVPSDYEYVMSYSLATSQDGFQVPSYNVNCFLDSNHSITAHSGDCCLIGMYQDKTKSFAKHGGTGKCTICGASFVYGDVWCHIESGEYIHVGHNCADKMNSPDRRAFEYGRTKFVADQAKLARLEKFYELNDGMKLVFSVADKDSILADMKSKVMEWGSLTEKQIAFAKKLADAILNPVVRDEPPPLVLPEGRGSYAGKFVAMKESEGPYGYVTKGLFLTEQDGKLAKIWMTVPNGYGEKNTEATIAVKLVKGDKVGFYFGNRPSIKG